MTLSFQPIFADDIIEVNPYINLSPDVYSYDPIMSIINGAATNEVINAVTPKSIETILTDIDPYSIAVNSVTNTIYALEALNCIVSVIDGDTYDVYQLDLESEICVSIAVNPNDNEVYVSVVSEDKIIVIDGNYNSVKSSFKTSLTPGMSPYHVWYDSITNVIFVLFNTGDYSNTVHSFDGDTYEDLNDNSENNFLHNTVLNTSTKMIYDVTHDYSIDVIDASTNGIIANIPLSYDPYDIAVNSNTNQIYVTSKNQVKPVSVIDGTDYCGTHDNPVDMIIGKVRLTTEKHGIATIDILSKSPTQLLPHDITVGSFYELTSCNDLGDRTITISYSDEDLIVLDESLLVISKYTQGEWFDLHTIVDHDTNTATAVSSSFSTFVLGVQSDESETLAICKK